MKKGILIFLVFCSHCLSAQFLPNFDNIKLERGTDYKAAEPFALEAASYLLSTPVEKENTNRQNSLQFIAKWMRGTPDYSFAPDEATIKLLKGNNDLFGLYVAAMIKYSLENKASSKDRGIVKLNAMTLLLGYCEKKQNNIKMTKELKKLAEAKEKGTLEQSLL